MMRLTPSVPRLAVRWRQPGSRAQLHRRPQKLKGYPVRELGGLVRYSARRTDLPRWDLYVWPNAIRRLPLELDCNWLQPKNTAD